MVDLIPAGEGGAMAAAIAPAVKKLMADAGVLGEGVPDDFVLRPLLGGRSGAGVFKAVSPISAEGQVALAPVVLKIGARADIERERSNYERLVRQALAPSARPCLLGFAAAGEQAMLCYSLLGDRETRTLTDCLQRGEIAAIDIVLRDIIGPLRESWYGSHHIRRQPDIARRYREGYFTGRPDITETETQFRGEAARYFGTRCDGGQYTIGPDRFPMLGTALFGAGRWSYRSCIQHGDLNSDNIVMRSDPAGAALVDFHKTGRGHIHEDLVAIETSIRINHPLDIAFGDIMAAERSIALGHKVDGPYAAAIRAVRAAAMACFGESGDVADYQFAVAAIGLRLMQAQDISDGARARIIASALWAARLWIERRPG